MLMREDLAKRQLRAPAHDGGTLIEPPPTAVAGMLAENARTLAVADYDFQGQSLPALAAEARRELLTAAWQYSRNYRDVGPQPAANARLLLAGHQPELFHPGVWYKNFVLSQLAREHQAVAVNLVIDSDTIKSASIRVPMGSIERPSAEAVAIDHGSAEIPFEQRSIEDHQLFASFGRRVAAAISPLVPRPLVETFWPLAVERSRATDNFGLCLSQARHQFEGTWGATTLELPQSRVCRLPSFFRFSAHLLSNLPRLWEIYNAAITEYRQQNHIRSAAHPVPELAAEGRWLEAPFWIWTNDQPLRRRLFVRQQRDRLELSDRDSLCFQLDVSADTPLDRAVEQLDELAARGIKIRTRALITTLLARVLLGDLFVHGIGGAKYDQLTDRLIQGMFGLEPPGFLVASATLRLPIVHPAVQAGDLRRYAQQLRDLEFHPEVYLQTRAAQDASLDGVVAAAAQEKRQWIDTPAGAQNARQRCWAIRQINANLQPYVESQRQQLLAERERLQRALKADRLLASREFAFCLFPAERLQRLLVGDTLASHQPLNSVGHGTPRC